MSGTQSKYWVFTLNNPPRTDVPKDWEDVAVYCVWQLEEGKEGTRHLQGYVILPNKTRLSGVKKLSDTAHWEPRGGTHNQAKTYCTKADTRVDGPFEYGTEPAPSRQGRRTDLDSVKERITDGALESQLWESNFSTMVRYHRGITEYINQKQPDRRWKTVVHVLWGPTGCGKSHAAREESGEDAYWKFQGNNEWWCGYTNQSNVVIDEYYGWLKWSQLLRLLDEYPLRVETKGGSRKFVARTIWITSNSPPTEWYTYTRGMSWPTLERRLTTIRTRSSRADDWTWTKGSSDAGGMVEPRERDLVEPHVCDGTVCAANSYKSAEIVDLTE